MENINFFRGNLFTSKCQTLVNTVNCVGIMGAGIALEFRYRYPKMYERYVELCQQRQIQIGKLWLYTGEPNRRFVLNFPTKNDWKYESKPEYLQKGLQKFLETYKEKGITSVAFPLLGADKGGLDPEFSREIMERYLSLCDIPVEIYQFDPYAQDDLIDIAYDVFTRGKTPDIAKRTGIDTKTITKIRKVLESNNNVNSLNQLSKIKGIGEATMEKCYEVVQRQRVQPKSVSQDLFTQAITPSEPINGKTYAVAKKGKVENGNIPTSEKVRLTGLDLQTIFNIENHKEEVSVKDVRIYCEKLKLNPVEVLSYYFGELQVR